jgi:hypothetical protein
MIEKMDFYTWFIVARMSSVNTFEKGITKSVATEIKK